MEDHERVKQGVAFLLDRQCTDGGWNFGNPVMLGKELAGYPATTAWALLALQGLRAEPVRRGMDFLAGLPELPSAMALAMLTLARLANGVDPGEAMHLLVQRQQDDGGFFGRCDVTALAAGALGAALGAGHPFLLARQETGQQR